MTYGAVLVTNRHVHFPRCTYQFPKRIRLTMVGTLEMKLRLAVVTISNVNALKWLGETILLGRCDLIIIP